jgi:hypothetical protein
VNEHNSGHDVIKEPNVERMRLFVEQVQANGRFELIDALGVGEITLTPHTDLSSAGGRAEQGADGVLDVPGALFCLRDVDGGLEFRADRDPAGG